MVAKLALAGTRETGADGHEKSPELAAFDRLGLMGVIGEEDLFSPSKAKEGAYSRALKRHLRAIEDQAAAARFTPRSDTAVKWGACRMGHTRRMECLERCIAVQAQRERNSLRRRVRLLKAARDLELHQYVKHQDIAQRVLEAKASAGGNRFHALTAADRAAMPKPVVRWLLPGLLPAGDMTIVGGLPKVGKTRFAVAVVGAALKGEPILDLPAPADARPVVLVTDDQADGNTAEMLSALDLWSHPQLIWSRSFRLTESDIDRLLETVKQNPGALVVLDSLRSISRALQHGENDPEIGATLYDLKEAVTESGGTLLLIHHGSKTADRVGVEALSGHNAIAGAADTVLTLHYLPGDNGQPSKGRPERRLVREARSGEGFDLVATLSGNGYRKVASMDQWQQEARQAERLERLAPLQQDALDALERSGEWMTRRQVCEALGIEWGDRGKNREAANADKALRRLVEVGAAVSQRAGREATWRFTRRAQEDKETREPISHAKGFDLVSTTSRQGRQGSQSVTDSLSALSPLPDPDPIALLSPLSPNEGDKENARPICLAPLSPLSPPVCAHDLNQPALPLEVREPLPVARLVGGDDPHWPPRAAA